jgi:hypothetical protein
MYKFIITEEGGRPVGEFTKESAPTEFLRDLIANAEKTGKLTEEDPDGCEVTASIVYDKAVFETEIRDALRMSTEYEGSNAKVFAPPCLWGEFIAVCKAAASEKNLKVDYAKTEDEVDIWAWGPDDGEEGMTWRIRAVRD